MSPRRHPKLAPSILSADFSRLGEAAAAAERGGADWLHVDVMDGHYVPDLTFGPKMVADLHRATGLPLDVHLMIREPDRWIGQFAQAGAAYLTFHVETAPDPAATLAAIRSHGSRPGITSEPGTPLGRVLPHVGAADLVLVMSVQPGRGGQGFLAGSLERIRATREALDAAGSTAELVVDGGIKAGNCAAVRDAGASVLVAGSAVYLDPDGPEAAIAKLRKALA